MLYHYVGSNCGHLLTISRGAPKLMGENQSVFWAEFFNSKSGSFVMLYSSCIGRIQPLLVLKPGPKLSDKSDKRTSLLQLCLNYRSKTVKCLNCFHNGSYLTQQSKNSKSLFQNVKQASENRPKSQVRAWFLGFRTINRSWHPNQLKAWTNFR